MAGIEKIALAMGVHVSSIGRYISQFRKVLAVALALPGIAFAQAQMATLGSFVVNPSGAASARFAKRQ